MEVEDFADPWEHVRMLADARRNAALGRLLDRRAPGARVLEIGCGTGLWSCIAARLGAASVVALEPTATAALARRLVAENGLSERVEVVEALVEETEPRPVDLVFTELQNVDPFAEGLVEALAAGQRWLAEDGSLAPRRLVVHVAALAHAQSAAESRRALGEVERLAAAYDLDLGALEAALAPTESYRFATHQERPLGPSAVAFDLDLAATRTPPSESRITLEVPPGRIGGVLVWFEAELDDGIVLDNPPGTEGDGWGQLAVTWARPAVVERGALEILVRVVDGALDAVALGEP